MGTSGPRGIDDETGRLRFWLLAAVVGLLLAAWSGTAAAAVVLDTAVSKVETTLDAGGGVKRELLPAEDVVAGEELRYTITFTNESATAVDAERVVVTNPIPPGTRYVAGSAGGAGSRVEFSTDGESFTVSEPAGAADSGGAGSAANPPVHSLRWTYQQALEPGESGEVHFHVRMQ